MSRFVIRNYGPSRQIPYKGRSICLSNDQCIETDDVDMATVLGEEKLITVTDRGVEFAVPAVPETTTTNENRQVTIDDAEAVHAENFPDEDEDSQTQEQETQDAEQPLPDDAMEYIDYNDLTVKELRVLCEDRQIEVDNSKGYVKKDELIGLLEDYDSAEDLPDESE